MKEVTIHTVKKTSYLTSLVVVFLLLVHSSCQKDWLDAKPDKSLVIPKSIKDYQALLDNSSTISVSSGQIPFNVSQPSIDEISAGDFYVENADNISNRMQQTS